ncbi:MAG: MBL fold metallo-hydrolase [Clostridia bacterium]|nr:MBL fold metallo-hydrolase [Clostridia bacterium]
MEAKWLLENVPAYGGGELHPMLFNCGSGMADDFGGPTAEDSFMHIVNRTTEAEYLDYIRTLEENGYVTVFENRTDAGLFRQLSGKNRLYVYYIFNERMTRIILENSGVSLPEFEAPAGPTVHDDTALMQFGLTYGDMIRGFTSDCGMLYAIRTRDNSVIVIDGGSTEQSTEPATDEFYARLCALTGNPEKIRIAAWFCTHPHGDHMAFFSRMLAKYPDKLFVERAMFNFALSEAVMPGLKARIGLSGRKFPNTRAITMERILANNPKASYLKLHSGQRFELCGTEVEVLLTHEDTLTRFPDKLYWGMNETSTILKISFDGKSVIFLGDAWIPNGNILIGRYPWHSVNCDFLQVAHHCIDHVENFYEFIRTEYMLVPEGRYLLLKFISENFQNLKRHCAEDKIMVAGDATTVFRVANGKITETEFFPPRGCPYDGSQI